MATPASAPSANISFSSDPTEDRPVTVTVSGSSEALRDLFVLRTKQSSCAATAAARLTAAALIARR